MGNGYIYLELSKYKIKIKIKPGERFIIKRDILVLLGNKEGVSFVSYHQESIMVFKERRIYIIMIFVLLLIFFALLPAYVLGKAIDTLIQGSMTVDDLVLYVSLLCLFRYCDIYQV